MTSGCPSLDDQMIVGTHDPMRQNPTQTGMLCSVDIGAVVTINDFKANIILVLNHCLLIDFLKFHVVLKQLPFNYVLGNLLRVVWKKHAERKSGNLFPQSAIRNMYHCYGFGSLSIGANHVCPLNVTWV